MWYGTLSQAAGYPTVALLTQVKSLQPGYSQLHPDFLRPSPLSQEPIMTARWLQGQSLAFLAAISAPQNPAHKAISLRGFPESPLIWLDGK